jgi:hypothetical protein
MLSRCQLLCCWQLCAVVARDRARLLGLLCFMLGCLRGAAKDLLKVSSKTLTEAGSGGAGAASGAQGGSVCGTAAAMAAASGQRRRRRCRAAAKSQKVGRGRLRSRPPSEVEGVSAEGGGSRRTGGNPLPLSI